MQFSFLPNFIGWQRRYCLFALAALFTLFSNISLAGIQDPTTPPKVILPKYKITSDELAVIYLEDDEISKKVAWYYQEKRDIPTENIFSVKLKANKVNIKPKDFIEIKQALNEKLHENIQAFALTWAQPYRVGCMSMSAAFAFGYDPAYCAKGCNNTKPSHYFHSKTLEPSKKFKLRPTMMLATSSYAKTLELIDRGIAADNSQPKGNVFLLNTDDIHRSVRHNFYEEINKQFRDKFSINILEQNAIENKSNIMFYFTGLVHVPHLETLSFLPGAMADHLTSYGGKLTDSKQMSAINWLDAGATGSYGTAIEPCNITQKFPNPVVAMWHYTKGATLIEAYWKSVHMPGQGNFIGEPLASPYSGYELKQIENHLQLHSPVLYRGKYRLLGINDHNKNNTSTRENIYSSEHVINKNKQYIDLLPPYFDKYIIERISR